MANGFTSFSVGAFRHNGSEMGGSFKDHAEAVRFFESLRNNSMIASIELYGWNDENGDCELLDSHCA